jgi:hypothetical protein
VHVALLEELDPPTHDLKVFLGPSQLVEGIIE